MARVYPFVCEWCRDDINECRYCHQQPKDAYYILLFWHDCHGIDDLNNWWCGTCAPRMVTRRGHIAVPRRPDWRLA